jgi:hypothetical protein
VFGLCASNWTWAGRDWVNGAVTEGGLGQIRQVDPGWFRLSCFETRVLGVCHMFSRVTAGGVAHGEKGLRDLSVVV